MKIIKNILLSIFLSAVCALTVSAQQAPPSPPTTADLQKRITEMEAEMKLMRDELTKIKNALTASSPTPSPAAANASTVSQSEVKTETKPAEQPAALNNPKPVEKAAAATQTKTLGVDLGSARLTPYGTIYFNAFSNSAGTNNADIPLFATPTGAGTTSASVRQTRLGLRLEGAKVGSARLSAIIEADFYGGFPSVGIGENFNVVRMRLANARLD